MISLDHQKKGNNNGYYFWTYLYCNWKLFREHWEKEIREMGAFLLIVIIVGIIGYFTCSKEARVMRDVDRMINRNAEETKKRHGINK